MAEETAEEQAPVKAPETKLKRDGGCPPTARVLDIRLWWVAVYDATGSEKAKGLSLNFDSLRLTEAGASAP
jgi:hypothetical protein